MIRATTSTAVFVERLYAAAAQAGLLQRCRRFTGTRPSPAVWVALIEPDEALLDGLAVASDPSIRFPAHRLVGLKKGEVLEVDGTRYRVREVRAIGDGSEKQAQLGRV